VSQTRQALPSPNHSAHHHPSSNHAHLHPISTVISSSTKGTHTHTVTVRSRWHIVLPKCSPQGLLPRYLPVSSVFPSLLRCSSSHVSSSCLLSSSLSPACDICKRKDKYHSSIHICHLLYLPSLTCTPLPLLVVQ